MLMITLAVLVGVTIRRCCVVRTRGVDEPDRRREARTIAWLVRGPNRKVRYRGIERNRIWLAHRAAAVNLNRLVNLGLTRTPNGWAIA